MNLLQIFFIFSGAKIKLHDHQNFLNDAFKNVSVVVSCGESFEVRRYVFNSTQSGKETKNFLSLEKYFGIQCNFSGTR